MKCGWWALWALVVMVGAGCDDGAASGAVDGGGAEADRSAGDAAGLAVDAGGEAGAGEDAGGEGDAGAAVDGGSGGPVEVAPCVETVRVGALEVFAYEASRPDATDVEAGSDEARPCSRAGVLPWTNIAWPDASRVCLGAGFRLCSNAEWQRACEGEARQWHFPYALHHQPARCNDHVSGSGMMEPTGTRAECRTPEGAYDMSGNAWELTADGARRGASWKINAVMFRVDSARCDTYYDVADGFADDDVGFRCCR